MCLNESYSGVQVGEHLSDMFPTKNAMKQGDALTPLFFNTALEYDIRKVQTKTVGSKFNGTQQLLVYADDILGGSIYSYTIEKHAKALVVK